MNNTAPSNINESLNAVLDHAVQELRNAEFFTKTASQNYDTALSKRDHHVDFKALLTGYPRYEFTESQWHSEFVNLEAAIEAARNNYKKVQGEELKVRLLVEKLESAVVEFQIYQHKKSKK
jgi:conjugal transfer/entry exclusion protein